jgi:aromatic ring-cleaving dioxygenase
LPQHVYNARNAADIIRRAIGNRFEVIYRSRLDQRIRLYSSIEALRAALEIAERG